jgi:hypothetical protein
MTEEKRDVFLTTTPRPQGILVNQWDVVIAAKWGHSLRLYRGRVQLRPVYCDRMFKDARQPTQAGMASAVHHRERDLRGVRLRVEGSDQATLCDQEI